MSSKRLVLIIVFSILLLLSASCMTIVLPPSVSNPKSTFTSNPTSTPTQTPNPSQPQTPISNSGIKVWLDNTYRGAPIYTGGQTFYIHYSIDKDANLTMSAELKLSANFYLKNQPGPKTTYFSNYNRSAGTYNYKATAPSDVGGYVVLLEADYLDGGHAENNAGFAVVTADEMKRMQQSQ
jgi:hypothetical protein